MAREEEKMDEGRRQGLRRMGGMEEKSRVNSGRQEGDTEGEWQ